LAYQALLRRENRRLAEEESRAQERLQHQAYHDDLTDLPNRILFCDHLRLAIARAKRYHTRCAVLFFDMDQFKVINDSLGHEAGDQILVAMADRLRTKIREVDTVARFGGDEFSVLVQDIQEVLDAAKLAEILLAALSEPVVVAGKEHVLTTSVGIALYPDDGEDEATLLKHADIAMYQAKRKGRNAYKLFTPAMNDAAEERLAVEQGFREALSNGHLEVHYQPIIDLASRKPIGCEALLRWNHPKKGLIGPASFIGVAEQTGLIVPAGEWVLEVACTWAQKLESTLAQDLSIAVNLSPRQLQERSFAAKVAAILNRTGLDPSRLQLEITESMALEADSTVEVLSGLRDLGVRIAIDDLGTGFSGLSRLRDLPMDVIKIDRSFIRKIHADPVGEAIVRGVVGIAKALDLYVVAEGVETEEQLAVVKRLKCNAVQGFLLHRPLPPEELTGLFK
jgi:diguanylate cyclase (GGDEF)-like protein